MLSNCTERLTVENTSLEYAPFSSKRRLSMADPIDLANDLIESEVTRALSKLRQSTDGVTEGAKTCVECGEAIPEGRRKLGFKLCVPCAEEFERKKSLFADY